MEETNQNLPEPASSGQSNIGLAIVAYILFFIPLLTEQKNDPFVRYHVRQGFVLFVVECIILLIGQMLVFYWLSWLLNLAVLALFIVGVINAASGKEKPLPLIGQLVEKVNFL